MAGGGKTATSSSSVQIPPEVLARYNSVNAQAQTAANQPFQQYSTNPSAFVAPLNSTQQAAIANTNAYSGAAQPYYGAASQALGAGVNAAVPLVGQSAGTIGQAQDIGNAYNQAAAQGYATAPGAADPYNQAASASYGAGLAAGMPMNAMSAQNVGQAQQQGTAANLAALGQYGQAQQAVSPYNQAAGSAYGAGLAAATPFTLAGGQAVNAQQIGGQQIGQFMSPYLGSVYNATLAGENMQNAQQASGLQGQAIQAGAFGGDRSGIAQANLAYQQNLANAQTNANILNTGYGQALGAAQQQQGVNLAAQQANRAALQATGQNLYGQLTGTGQALAGLGQNVFGQGTAVAQGVGALGQQQYAQGMGAAAQQAALGNQAYNQYTGTGQALAGLGQNVYGQQVGAAQGLAGVGNQAFGQGATTAAQQAALGNQVYGMGTGAAQTLGALGTGAQAAGLQGAQAQMAAGTQAQQTQQAGLSALYNQFLQQQAYPFQTAQFLANIAEGTGALSGSTTTTTQPMGLLAARGGSIRGGYNSGGLVPSSMGGAVGAEHAGEGFAGGGMPQVGSYGKGSAGGGYGQQGGYNPFAGINFGGLGQYGQNSAPPMQMGNVGADTTFGTIDRAPAVTPWVAPTAPAAGLGATQGGVWQMPTEFGGGQGGSGSGSQSSAEVNQADIEAQENVDAGAAGLASGGRIHKLGGGSIDPDYLSAMRQYQAPAPGGLTGLYGGKPGSTPGASSYVPAANQPVAHLMTAQAPMRQMPTPGSDLRTAAADVNALRGMYGAGKAGLFGTPGVAAQGNTPAQQPTQGLAQWLGLSSDNTMPAARGGLIGHFADGGEVPDALAIPNDQPNIRGLQAAQTPGQGPSTLGGLRGLAGDIGAVKTLGSAGAGLLGLVGLARGGVAGRHGYAEDGYVGGDDGGGGGDIEPQSFSGFGFEPTYGYQIPLNAKILQKSPTTSAAPPDFDRIANVQSAYNLRDTLRDPIGSFQNWIDRIAWEKEHGQSADYAMNQSKPNLTQNINDKYPALDPFTGLSLNPGQDHFANIIPSEPAIPGLDPASNLGNNDQSTDGVTPKPNQSIEDAIRIGRQSMNRIESGSPSADDLNTGTTNAGTLSRNGPPDDFGARATNAGTTNAGTTNAGATNAGLVGGTQGNTAAPTNGLAGASQTPAPRSTSYAAPSDGDWMQRNQNWLAPLLMGLQGARGARGIAGALIGAGAGAAQGYEGIQNAMQQRAYQQMQTEIGPQRVAIEARTQDQQLLNTLMQRRIGFAQLGNTPELAQLDNQINALVAKISQQATPGGAPGGGPIMSAFPSLSNSSAPAARPAQGAQFDYSNAPAVDAGSRDAAIRTILGEASGEGYNGMKAVAHVIINRSAASGAPLSDVVHSPNQFEPWQTRANQLNGYDPNSPEYKAAAKAFDDALANPKADNTGGATLFYSPSIMQQRGQGAPDWGQGSPSAVIGDHRFFTGSFPGMVTQPPGGQNQVAQAPAPAASATNPAQPEALRVAPTDTNAANVFAQYQLQNPNAIRYLHSAQSAGYSSANDPEQIIARGNRQALAGDAKGANELWNQARDELSRLASQGQFVDAQGHMQMVPGWLDLETAKARIPANSTYFDDQARQQVDRSKKAAALSTMGDVLQGHATGALSGIKGDIEGFLKGIGINSQALAGTRAANQILEKEAIMGSSSLDALGLHGAATDYKTGLQGKTSVSPHNEPEANQRILAQAKAAQVYENMYLKDELAASMLGPLNRASFASAWESQHPGLMHNLVEDQIKITPVRGIQENPNVPDGTQFIREPGWQTSNGQTVNVPTVVEYRNGKPRYIRSVQ